jgi:RNA polymerase sigma-70 factor, ECF subfamily
MQDPGNEGLNAQAVEQYRPYLLRYAQFRLRNEARAEDVVQETLLAALQGASAFSGKSSVKTWLTGILKHKITDQFRLQSREQATLPSEDWSEHASEEAYASSYFETETEKEHWRSPPNAWPDPEQSYEQKRFWDVVELCLRGLPAKAARVFTMREIMGMDTEDICKELGISATNCWVMLYRARMNLRQCLDTRWFGNTTS